MRKLTLGTLIASGALLVSLPFRRSDGPDGPDVPLVTGPTASWNIQQPPASDATWTETLSGPLKTPVETARYSTSPSTTSPAFTESIASAEQTRPRRDIRQPLTFDDLAIPESTPHYRSQRFEALATSSTTEPKTMLPTKPSRFESVGPLTTVRAHAERQNRPVTTGPTAPRFESFATSSDEPTAPWHIDQEQPQSVLVRTASQATEPNTRPRQWIRQPE
ncbi:MAG: hypothetical protein AAF539_05025 [Planctomycetota bacterium]